MSFEFTKTGLPIATYFSLSKILWLLRNVDDVNKAKLDNDLCFGTIDSCQYNLEQLVSSAVKNIDLDSIEANLSDENRKTMDQLSELSYNAYVDFKNHPKFLNRKWVFSILITQCIEALRDLD